MRRVLVIDDHEPSRRNLAACLAVSGYQISGEGASGNTAVALAAATAPDAVSMAFGLSDVEAFRPRARLCEPIPVPPQRQQP